MTKKSGIAKILEEFGFLWAIRQKWDAPPTVNVVYATEKAFDAPVPKGASDVWVCGSQDGLPQMLIVSRREGMRLGFYVRYEGRLLDEIEFVVIDHSQAAHYENSFVIYGPPRGRTFKNFLERYAPRESQVV